MSAAAVRLEDYEFELPLDAIAQRPPARRTESKLLCWNPDGSYEHLRFASIESRFRAGDLLVLNDTRVFPARLFGRKESGSARVEILLLRPAEGGDSVWEAMLRPGRRLPPGSRIILENGLALEVGSALGGGRRELGFPAGTDVWDLCDRLGHVPLPPYISRADEEADLDRYQTVFARDRGSVAAPTAGLHFDQTLLDRLGRQGVDVVTVTLHVGPGTFQPLDEKRLAQGELHPEELCVSAETLDRLQAHRAEGGRIVAVGTTVCRTLESIPEGLDRAERGFRTDTRLLIRPGHRFRWVDVLITNFHLPRSSLLLLVAALGGERWREAYALALREGYRFYSYGDANWIERNP